MDKDYKEIVDKLLAKHDIVSNISGDKWVKLVRNTNSYEEIKESDIRRWVVSNVNKATKRDADEIVYILKLQKHQKYSMRIVKLIFIKTHKKSMILFED